MKLLGALLAAVLLITPWERAARLAEAGDLPGAEAEYRAILADAPDDATAHYNLGTVLLRQGRFEDARPFLQRAAAAPDDIQEEASYNMGNTDLEPAFADAELPDRSDRLRRSIEAYKTALLLDPEDFDAKWNLELARRLLEGEETPPEAGGGGGGGGGRDDSGSGRPDRAPLPGGGAGPQPQMSRAEAEELLSAARDEELQVQRDRLRKPQPPGPVRP
ncbi:MAG: tetratricopeptide repeat protein [Gemmatimonadota bacterium]